MTGPAEKILVQLPRFLRYVFLHFPLARLALLLTLMVMLAEYLTFSLMIPLSGRPPGGTGERIVAGWSHAANFVGLPASGQSWLLFFLFLLAIRILLGFVLVWVNTYLSKQVHAALSNSVFSQVVEREPLALIYRRTAGHYISIAGDDTSRAGNIVLCFGQLFSAILDALIGLLLLYFFSPPTLIATLAYLFISACAVGYLLRLSVSLNSRITSKSRAIGTYFIDCLNGIRSLRSMFAERHVILSYRQMIRDYLADLVKAELVRQLMRAGPALLIIAIGIAWAWPGNYLANQSRGSLYFLALTMLLVRLFVSLGAAVTKGEALFTDLRAAHDIDSITPHGETMAPAAPQRETGRVHSISLEGIDYAYSPQAMVLCGLNAKFEARKVYSISGESGAGKSTVADVILGFLAPDSGTVRLADELGRAMDPHTLRARIILVEQQTRIFTGTLRDNILMGHVADDSELERAVRGAGLLDFVDSRPEGLARLLDYQGSNLSGGQRQRIGLARALVRSPDVLILDEATSALDTLTRGKVLDSVIESIKSGILILITHDPHVADVADLQFELRNGMLLKTGPSGQESAENG